MNYYAMEKLARLKDKERLRDAEHARLVSELRQLQPSRGGALHATFRAVGAWLRRAARKAGGVASQGVRRVA